MESLWNLIELLDRKITEINSKGDISPTELENACKAMKTVYYALCADAMMNADDDMMDDYEEQSFRGGRSYRSYANGGGSGRSYRQGGGSGRSYRSYARGGSGRSYRSYANGGSGGYSGHTEKEALMQQIAEMQQELERMQ